MIRLSPQKILLILKQVFIHIHGMILCFFCNFSLIILFAFLFQELLLLKCRAAYKWNPLVFFTFSYFYINFLKCVLNFNFQMFFFQSSSYFSSLKRSVYVFLYVLPSLHDFFFFQWVIILVICSYEKFR